MYAVMHFIDAGQEFNGEPSKASGWVWTLTKNINGPTDLNHGDGPFEQVNGDDGMRACHIDMILFCQNYNHPPLIYQNGRFKPLPLELPHPLGRGAV